jgi:hypothetical protein
MIGSFVVDFNPHDPAKDAGQQKKMWCSTEKQVVEALGAWRRNGYGYTWQDIVKRDDLSQDGTDWYQATLTISNLLSVNQHAFLILFASKADPI